MESEIIKASGYDVLYLASCALCGKTPKSEIVKKINLSDVRKICRFQSVSALVYSAMQSADNQEIKEDESFRMLANERLSLIRRQDLLDEERKSVLDFLEKNKIWYLPLKGVIIKDFYPNPFLREMSDNDILYDSDYTEKVSEFFVNRGYEKFVDDDGKDECYIKPPVYNFEMHRELFEDLYPEYKRYYSDVKNKLIKDSDNAYGYHLSDEDFYIYMTAHACKHYNISGTGIRGLFDTYVFLTRKDNLNWRYINEEIKKLGISKFEKINRSLCMKIPSFFSEHKFYTLNDDEEYLLKSMLYAGAYGSGDNILRNQVIAFGDKPEVSFRSKVKYFFSRLFPSYFFMHSSYPYVVRNRLMMPFGYIYRIVKVGIQHRKSIIKEIKKVFYM